MAELTGRSPDPSGAGRDVLTIRSPNTGHQFEWHPKSRRVYLVRTSVVPPVGEVVAFDVETHGQALNYINTWLRGWHEGQTPSVAKPNLQV